MKCSHPRQNVSQTWLLLAYTMCMLSVFGTQHYRGRQIVMGLAAFVVLLVVGLFVHCRMRGGCAVVPRS